MVDDIGINGVFGCDRFRLASFTAPLGGLRIMFGMMFMAMSLWQLGETNDAIKWHNKALAWSAENVDMKVDGVKLSQFFAEAAKLMSDDGSNRITTSTP